jgi:triosephosphate isomerase
MIDRPRPLVAGNWKMNGLKSSLNEIAAMGKAYDPSLRAKVDLLICPPATLSSMAAHVALGTHIAIGAQDCHSKASGAHTGDISAEMLGDLGLTHVILGHSERRADHSESDALVRSKAEAAVRASLIAIVCVGETEAERRAGETLDVIGRQIDGSIPPGLTAAQLVVAYEPVWAIGSGLTPTAADVAEVHAFIRDRLGRLVGAERLGVRLLYGGSVKPSNAAELMGVANVDGALVGGASLKADDFMAIAAAYR